MANKHTHTHTHAHTHTHRHNGTWISHKEWNIASSTAVMELEGIMLSEISQVKKDKYQTNFIHMCKINEINKQIKQTTQVARIGWWLPEEKEGQDEGKMGSSVW